MRVATRLAGGHEADETCLLHNLNQGQGSFKCRALSFSVLVIAMCNLDLQKEDDENWSNESPEGRSYPAAIEGYGPIVECQSPRLTPQQWHT